MSFVSNEINIHKILEKKQVQKTSLMQILCIEN